MFPRLQKICSLPRRECIEEKSISNRFDLALFLLSGRPYAGRVSLFPIALLEGEKVWSVEFLLCYWKASVQIAQNVIKMDASAIVSATRLVFPSYSILLELWYLEQNQKRILAAFIRTSRSGYTSADMYKDLCELWNSSTSSTFMRKRHKSEEKYCGAYSGVV